MSKMGRKVKLRQNFASFFSAKLLISCGHSEPRDMPSFAAVNSEGLDRELAA
jgi:hypothetical protein